MAPHVFFELFNSNCQAALRIDAAIGLYASFDIPIDIPIDICGETLTIYRRLAADVRVWRRCSVLVDRCRPDVERGPHNYQVDISSKKIVLSGLFAN